MHFLYLGLTYVGLRLPSFYRMQPSQHQFFFCTIGWRDHPIRRFFQDGASFSVNTDDPTVTGHTLVDDYAIVASQEGVQLPLQALVDAVRNAAAAAFVDGAEKVELKRVVERKLEEVLKAAARNDFAVLDHV